MAKKMWTSQENLTLKEIITEIGSDDWTAISASLKRKCETANVNQRSGKQCRERWFNHLCPDFQKSVWTRQEEAKLFELHRINGNRWKQISKKFPGRTDNSIKNKFFSILRKGLRRINKSLGYKSSTDEIREIKPVVMTEILNFIYKSQGLQQKQYSEYEGLPSLLFSFSCQKPKNLKNSPSDNRQVQAKIQIILLLVKEFKQKKLKKQNQNQTRTETKSEAISSGFNQMNFQESSGNLSIRNHSIQHFDHSIIPIAEPVKQYQKQIENLIEEDKGIKFNEDSEFHGSFLSFDDPSPNFNPEFQDLVIIGRHLQPQNIQDDRFGLPQAHDNENMIDEILEENYE